MRLRRKLALLVIAVALSGCATTGTPLPKEEAGITGVITSIDGGGGESLRILVEEKPDEESGSAKSYVTIQEETRILLHEGEETYASASRDALRKGQRVKVWFDGPILESYPTQTTAGVVLILE